MEQPPVKFDKSFEALYKIAMSMADACIVNKPIDARFEKLLEEYNELSKEYHLFKIAPDHSNEKATARVMMKKEAADLLFVLLHIAHLNGWTAFDLLHDACHKLLLRMNDPNYIAKN